MAVATVDCVRDLTASTHVIEATEGRGERVVTVRQPDSPATTREWTPLDARVTVHKRLHTYTENILLLAPVYFMLAWITKSIALAWLYQ